MLKCNDDERYLWPDHQLDCVGANAKKQGGAGRPTWATPTTARFMLCRVFLLAVLATAASTPPQVGQSHHKAGASLTADAGFDGADEEKDGDDDDLSAAAESLHSLGAEPVRSLPAAPEQPASRSDAVPARRAPGRPSPGRSASSLQFMITLRMKEQLRGLGYLTSEIAGLHPQRAAAIIDRSIPRPMSGVPASWLASSRAASRLGPVKVLKRAVAGAAKISLTASAGLLFYLSCGGQLPPDQQRHVDRANRWLRHTVKPPTRYRSPML
jgi:hypothetical protein